MEINIVLVQPEIAYNAGAVGRLCVALDARLHLVKPLGFVLTERQLRRAGLDYWQHVKLSVHDSWELFLKEQKPQRLFFGSTRGRRSLYETCFQHGDYLAFGSESRGLPAEFYTLYREQLFVIPSPGDHARSHNLSHAVAVAAYEMWRQLHIQTNG